MDANRTTRMVLVAFCLWLISQGAWGQTDPPDSYGVRMAESIMARKPGVYGDWNYETGTVMRGFEMLYAVTGDTRYLQYIRSTVDSAVDINGGISGFLMSDFNLDQVKEGTSVLFLYELSADTRYAVAASLLMTQLIYQPRTSDGGFWHKGKYPNQMWLDGLYMAQPFRAHYALVFDRAEDCPDILLQLQLMEDHARDPGSGLLYHGWDESGAASWADPETGASPVFWGRSLGWYAMALVDVLDHLPEQETALREQVIAILGRLVTAVSAVQDIETGVWWQVADKGGQSGNWVESSCTAMFVYAVAKAVRLGYVATSYQSVARAGWEGLLDEFVTTNGDGTLNLVETCVGTGVGDDYGFYVDRPRDVNDPKGLGPFLMAAAEIEFGGLRENTPPEVVAPIADVTLPESATGQPIDLTTVFTDADGDTLTFQLYDADANVALAGNTLQISGGEIGVETYRVTARDDSGGTAVTAFSITVTSRIRRTGGGRRH